MNLSLGWNIFVCSVVPFCAGVHNLCLLCDSLTRLELASHHTKKIPNNGNLFSLNVRNKWQINGLCLTISKSTKIHSTHTFTECMSIELTFMTCKSECVFNVCVFLWFCFEVTQLKCALEFDFFSVCSIVKEMVIKNGMKGRMALTYR